MVIDLLESAVALVCFCNVASCLCDLTERVRDNDKQLQSRITPESPDRKE